MANLYQFKGNFEPRFCEIRQGIIQDDLHYHSWRKIASGDVVMFVDRIAYTKKTATAAAGAARAAAAAAAAASSASTPARAAVADWKEAYELWDKNQSITGAIYLHPTGQLIWISDIDIKYFDIKYFEKVESSK